MNEGGQKNGCATKLTVAAASRLVEIDVDALKLEVAVAVERA